jgi:hypothetical protein
MAAFLWILGILAVAFIVANVGLAYMSATDIDVIIRFPQFHCAFRHIVDGIDYHYGDSPRKRTEYCQRSGIKTRGRKTSVARCIFRKPSYILV